MTRVSPSTRSRCRTSPYLSGVGDHPSTPGAPRSATPVGSWMVLTGVDVLAPRPVNAPWRWATRSPMAWAAGSTPTPAGPTPCPTGWARRGGAATMSVLNAGSPATSCSPTGGRWPVAVGAAAAEVAEVPGATDVVLHIGTNDPPPGAADGRSSTARPLVHRPGPGRGEAVFLTTITPSDAGPHGTPAAAARVEVNACASAAREHADGVFDFAAAVADPAHPGRLLARYDSATAPYLSELGARRCRRRHPA